MVKIVFGGVILKSTLEIHSKCLIGITTVNQKRQEEIKAAGKEFPTICVNCLLIFSEVNREIDKLTVIPEKNSKVSEPVDDSYNCRKCGDYVSAAEADRILFDTPYCAYCFTIAEFGVG